MSRRKVGNVKQAKEIARVESYPGDELDVDCAVMLRKRIVECPCPFSLDIEVLLGRISAFLRSDVSVESMLIEPDRIRAVLYAPTPEQYKAAYNLLNGFEVDAQGEVVEDEDGKLKLLPSE